MKYVRLFNLENPYSPSHCCGDVLGLGSMIAGISVADANRSAQKSENARNRQFAHDEAELAREYQSKEWTRQYGLQRDEWYKQLAASSDSAYNNFVRQAEFNSPVNQMSRLRQAGINPSAMLGNQGSGLVSAATGNLSTISPSVPCGGPVAASVASPSGQGAIPPMSNPIPIDALGSFIKDLSTASRTNKLADAELNQIIAQTGLFIRQQAGQKLANDYQEICNFVASKTKDAKVTKAFSEIGQIWADVALKQKTGQMYDSMSIYYKAEEALSQAKKKLSDKEYEQLTLEVDHWLDAYEVRMQNMRSQTAANNASAAVNNAQAETIKQMREFVVDNAESVAKMNMLLAAEQGVKTDAILNNNKKFVEAFIANLERSKIITKADKERLYTMSMDNKQYVLRQICNYLGFIKNLSNPMSSVPAMGIANEEISSNVGMVDMILNQRPIVRGFAP